MAMSQKAALSNEGPMRKAFRSAFTLDYAAPHGCDGGSRRFYKPERQEDFVEYEPRMGCSGVFSQFVVCQYLIITLLGKPIYLDMPDFLSIASFLALRIPVIVTGVGTPPSRLTPASIDRFHSPGRRAGDRYRRG